MKLKELEIVEKKNVLNEIRNNNMTLQELRFFSIYLAKINPRDISTRVVKFKLEDFQKIMDLSEIKIDHFKAVVDRLLSKIVHVPNEDGSKGFTAFQLFKRCKVYEDENDYNQWYVEINAHDDALPLMFEFKEKYFRYSLWNVLRLNSGNQIRIYELLKQYEPIGMREIKLDQLKDWLGIAQHAYTRWYDFKKYVMESCQRALAENTDIKFDYELMKTGRRVTGVRFIIKKNKDYKDPLKLNEYISQKRSPHKNKKNIGNFSLDDNSSFTLDDLYDKIKN